MLDGNKNVHGKWKMTIYVGKPSDGGKTNLNGSYGKAW